MDIYLILYFRGGSHVRPRHLTFSVSTSVHRPTPNSPTHSRFLGPKLTEYSKTPSLSNPMKNLSRHVVKFLCTRYCSSHAYKHVYASSRFFSAPFSFFVFFSLSFSHSFSFIFHTKFLCHGDSN